MPKTSQKSYSLPASHLLLALAIVAVWGTNFVVIKLSLAAFPPFLFAALRYTFAFLPLVFFVPRPKTSWVNLCIYGLAVGVGQFGVLYFAINGRISPGLASLVIQTQVFFTIGFAMFFAKERLRTYQMLAWELVRCTPMPQPPSWGLLWWYLPAFLGGLPIRLAAGQALLICWPMWFGRALLRFLLYLRFLSFLRAGGSI